MSKRYRLFVTAALGCLIALGFSVGLSWRLYPERIFLSGNTADESISAYDRKFEHECSSSRIKYLSKLNQLYKTDYCQKHYSEQRDLRNQYIQARRSADAADASAIYSFEQTRVAAVGAGFGVITMLAALYAGLAAHHTKRSADIALAQQRPWLDIQMQIDGSGILPGERQGVMFCLIVECRNSGPSPAVDVIIDAQIVHEFDPNRPDKLIEERRKVIAEFGHVKEIVPPGGCIMHRVNHVFGNGVIDKEFDGSAGVIFLASVGYRFAGTERYHFTQRLRVMGNRAGQPFHDDDAPIAAENVHFFPFFGVSGYAD